MANCYRCGRPIAGARYHLRRRVKTGEFERRRFAGTKAHTVQTHFGMRIVCVRCARALDLQAGRLWAEATLQIFLALLVLFLVLAFAG